MNRKSIICTVLALALVLMGTGYAYWADTLNVTTRATTGDFDVTFVDLGLYAQYGNERQENAWSIVDGIGTDGYVPADFFERGASDYNIVARPGSIEEYYERAEGYNKVNFSAELVDPAGIPVTVDGYVQLDTLGSDNLLLTVNNMYPGYAQAFRSDIVNIGSLAARLSALNFEVSGYEDFEINETTMDMLGIALLVEREYQVPGEEGADMFKLCSSLAALPEESFFTIGGVKFVRLSALEDIDPEVIEEANLLCLPNINRMDLYLGIGMDPDAEGVYTSGSASIMADNDDGLSQNKGVEISIDLLWDQFNEGKDAGVTNWLVQQN